MDNDSKRENSFYPSHSDVYIPWTIESQLRAYASHPQATERHEILWYSWKQIKRWLSQMLEYTLASFPAYSLHNETHCQAILHNIECLLGEPEIRKLSATNCFVILVSVYLHDIGMVITYSDRQDMIQSASFSELIDELRNSPNSVLQQAAAELQEVNYDFSKEPDEKARMKKLYEKKLKVFDSMSLILGEQQRKLHAEISEQRIKKWIDSPSKLQAGFELTQIPMRIFYRAAVCARIHGDSDFTLLEKCPQKDGGYAHDWYHPRFIAALLIIGDGLDLDNDRFHPFMEEYSGADFITETTVVHVNKHRSIQTLQISPRRIEISADCQTAEALRTLCNEIHWLENFLKNCNYSWNEIAPDNFSGSLPNIFLNPIRLNGTEIPAEMVTTRFAISQEKAFSLLQGSRIYNNHFTFLRELIQNACDAVKLQYWEDYSSSTLAGNTCSAEPQKANASIALSKYPIFIYLSVKKQKRGSASELSDITSEDLKNIEKLKESYKFGVLLEVQDFGIGISKNDIKEIAKVGTSHARQKNFIQKMPPWLRPTGHFGVGLQSLFLVCNSFKCITKTRSGECYDMTFHSRMNQDGYINVVPHPGIDSNGNVIPYGSCFSVFVEETFKESHEINMDGWAGIDPYRPDYEKLRSLRRSVELMLQLESAVDDFLGEMLFPICTYRYPLDSSLELLELVPDSDVFLTRSLFDVPQKQASSSAKAVHLKKLSDANALPPSCWLYSSSLEKGPLSGVLENGSAYLLDTDKAQLRIWSQEAQTFFICGSQRIQDLTHKQNLQSLNSKQKSSKVKTRLFIKGLFICDCSDSWISNTFIQFIDVKSDALNPYLQMNRDGLTAEGSQYLTNTLLPLLTETLRIVLAQISQDTVDKLELCKQDVIRKICDECALNLPESDSFREQKLAVIKLKLEGQDLLDYCRVLSREKLMEATKKQKSCDDLDKLLSFYLSENSLFNPDFLHDLLKDIPATSNQQSSEDVPSLSERFYQTMLERIRQIFIGQPDNFAIDFLFGVFQKVLCVQDTLSNTNPKEPESSQLYMLQDAAFSVQQMAFLCAMALLEVGQIQDPLHDDNSNGCVRPSKDKPCIWAHLNNQMENIIKSINKFLESNTTFPLGDASKIWHEYACIPTLSWDALSKIRWDSISGIFNSNRHFASFSTRVSSNSKWRHMLVEISQNAWDLFEESPKTEDLCNTHWHRLNQWCQSLVEQLVNAQDVSPSGRENTAGRRKNEDTDELWDSTVIRWMVHSIPSVALASDARGMNRLNVLSVRAKSTIFKDSRMINLLLDRLKHSSEDHPVERIQLLTLDGLSALNIKDSVSSNITSIIRGCVSAENKKNRMLVAFGSSLPQAITLSTANKGAIDKDSTDGTSNNSHITSVYQLFDVLKEPYRTGDSDFLPKEAQYILNVCDRISTQAEPFFKNANTDIDDALWNRIVHVHQCFLSECGNSSYASTDIRCQKSPDKKQLLKSMQTAYEGILTDAGRSQQNAEEQDSYPKWSDVEFLSDPEKFFNTVILQIFSYGVFPSQPKGFFLPVRSAVSQNFIYYDNFQAYNDEIAKILKGINYLHYSAADDYENTFVKAVLNWWKSEIWSKDFCSTALLHERAAELRVPISEEDLERNYLRQIEFFIRSTVSDVPSAVSQFNLERWASVPSKKKLF